MFLRADEIDGVLMNSNFSIVCSLCGMVLKIDEEEVIPCNCQTEEVSYLETV